MSLFGSYKKLLAALSTAFKAHHIDVEAIDFDAEDASAKLGAAIAAHYVPATAVAEQATQLAATQGELAQAKTDLAAATRKISAYEAKIGKIEAAQPAPAPAAGQPAAPAPTAEQQAKALEDQAAALRSQIAATELARAGMPPIALAPNGPDDEASTPADRVAALSAAFSAEKDSRKAFAIYQSLEKARKELGAN